MRITRRLAGGAAALGAGTMPFTFLDCINFCTTSFDTRPK